jgi:hypothetical protein
MAIFRINQRATAHPGAEYLPVKRNEDVILYVRILLLLNMVLYIIWQ